MIVLWVLSLLFVALYAYVVVRTDFEGTEGFGVIKWLVIASLIVIIVTLVLMGVRIWWYG